MSNPAYVQEYNAIVEVMNKYNEGLAKADSAIMKPAFSEKASMFSVDGNSKLTGEPVQQGLFDVVDSKFRPSPEAKAVFAFIDIVGTAASVRIDTNDLSGFCFTDFFHLLKVEGKWTVVSKIFYTHVAA
ncbi:nuclear transport factor 2 family protein [Edaphobacter bradus]|uniref:nuclear transport factor 2 family protein n=1 Tax=Edaphobacter bradus TaxID=2259016 RepID=UPI0021E06601|nr:nuclear transport factor 2 family protein [Edaphobacter bradus]